MKLVIRFMTCLSGALLGGFPGAVVAFWFVGCMGITASRAEVICCVANLALGIGGAFAGMQLTKAFRGQATMQVKGMILSVILGVICGLAGYVWLNSAIRHADPPL